MQESASINNRECSVLIADYMGVVRCLSVSVRKKSDIVITFVSDICIK